MRLGRLGECLGFLALLGAEPVADEVTQGFDRRVGHRVVGGGALGPALQDAVVVEDPEVLADIRLAHVQSLNELADVQLAGLAERFDDAQTVGIAEDPETPGDVFEEVWWERHVHHYITV